MFAERLERNGIVYFSSCFFAGILESDEISWREQLLRYWVRVVVLSKSCQRKGMTWERQHT